MTPFAEWLAREMAARGYQPDNRSQWATYLGTPYPTLSAWFNRGGRPSTEACEKIAARLSLPMATVLRMAGHPAPRERGTVPPASVPPWLADLIAGLDDAEQRMLGVTARRNRARPRLRTRRRPLPRR